MKDNRKPWTKEELDKLGTKPDNHLAVELDRTYDSVRIKRMRLGIQNPITAQAQAPAQAHDHPKRPVREQETLGEFPSPVFGRLPLSAINSGDWFKYGAVGDTHLCCKEERLAELHTTYDLFKQEGITTVFHAGNIVDGYIPKINGNSVYATGISSQAQYVLDNYPQRDGITTYFITGDDHEGWWQKNGDFNFGAYLAMTAKDQGRNDLQYIGHVESDIEIQSKSGERSVSTIIKVQHPGGGSAYSRSYTGQKQVEAFEGGEKPDILIQGHYHVSNMMNDRNIYVISLPGFQDQTIFARKKRLRMEVGAGIIEFKVNPDDGSITRFRYELIRYFTRGYYKNYIRSDGSYLKGHLVLDK